MAARSGRIDALRGLAVFGIMLVNVWGFVYGMQLQRFPTDGAALPLLDQLTVFFVAAFTEQKFYPIFSFLFGAGFALQTGARQAAGPALDATRALYRRRLRWLLVVGLLHGCLLWFGDILTTYAVTGFWLVHKAGQPLSRLVTSLRVLIIANLVLSAVLGAAMVAGHLLTPEQLQESIDEARRAHAIYTQGSWQAIAQLRLADFGWGLLNALVLLPRIALLFLLGVFAVRLGWLTRPERHRALWRKVLVTAACIGLPLNLWWGWASVNAAINPLTAQLSAGLAAAALDLAGPLLGAGYTALFMLAGPHVARLLVPVGRMALTNYLTQSLLLMLLLQGVGMGLGAHLSRAAMVALCAVLMLVQLGASHWWMARHQQGPLEALWRRYTWQR